MKWVIFHISQQITKSHDRICFAQAVVGTVLKQTRLKKRTQFNETRQYHIQIFNKNIFFKYRTKQLKTTKQISKLVILIAMAA